MHGLSPLARGIPALTPLGIGNIRFIPAGAGNTPVAALISAADTVYPRWRGEYIIYQPRFIIRGGLSPLARGTRGLGFVDTADPRFIPAGAGNTKTFSLTYPHAPVYPRWRGEHRVLDKDSGMIGGLSPLARGTQHGIGACRPGGRFIPAGAGNTEERSGATCGVPVYPRWRGEHTKRISLFINYFLSALHSTNIIATI